MTDDDVLVRLVQILRRERARQLAQAQAEQPQADRPKAPDPPPRAGDNQE